MRELLVIDKDVGDLSISAGSLDGIHVFRWLLAGVVTSFSNFKP